MSSMTLFKKSAVILIALIVFVTLIVKANLASIPDECEGDFGKIKTEIAWCAELFID